MKKEILQKGFYKQDSDSWQHSDLLGLEQVSRNSYLFVEKDSCVTKLLSFKNKPRYQHSPTAKSLPELGK